MMRNLSSKKRQLVAEGILGTKREFTELDFEELIDLKTGFTQYQNTRQKGGRYEITNSAEQMDT